MSCELKVRTLDGVGLLEGDNPGVVLRDLECSRRSVVEMVVHGLLRCVGCVFVSCV